MKVSKLFSVFVMVFVLTLMALLTDNVRVFAEHEDSALELETQEFRKNFNMDLNYDKSIAIKSEEFGVYLTSEEEKMLQDRFKKQDNDIKKVNEYLKENFSMDKIGGVFIDQEAGGIINISLKNNNSINSQEISSLQHIVDASIKFNNVLYSEEQLDNVHNNIAQELESLKKDHNITVYTVMTNLPDNKIDVYIEDLTDEKKDFLINRFGKSLDIKQGKKPIDDSRFTSYNPLQGGLAIGKTSSSTHCSSAYGAKDLAGNQYLITAAHCSGSSFYQGGKLIGTKSSTKWRQSGSVDAAAIKLSSFFSASRYLYTNYSKKNYVGSVQNTSNEYVGQAVCKAGKKTGATCGTLLSKNVSGNWSGYYYSGLRGATYSSDGGDSGGTVYYGNQLRGVHKGSTSAGNPVYSHVSNVNSALRISAIQ